MIDRKNVGNILIYSLCKFSLLINRYWKQRKKNGERYMCYYIEGFYNLDVQWLIEIGLMQRKHCVVKWLQISR